MNNDTSNKQTFWEKSKGSFGTALLSAGIIIAVFLVIWIPFKVIPALFSSGSNYVATTLSSIVIPGGASTTTNTTSNNKPSPKATPATNYIAPVEVVYYGKPDFEITLIGTGIIDPASKQFMSTNYAGFNDEIAIKFQVKNIGTNVSGAWKLRINAPSRTTPYFDSAYQTSIKPGDRIVFTTSFDSPINTGINTTYITADPLNMIDENYENNNQIIVPINIEGTSYSYNNNFNYGTTIAVPSVPYGTLYTWTNMAANCYANPQTSYIGNPITWYVSASGGNGYFSYSWTGSDQLYSTNNSVSHTYYSSGQKTATVTVTSNGTSITKQCSAYIY